MIAAPLVMSRVRLPLLLLLLVGSGAAGLAYQVLWLRELSLVFGVTIYAASTVLTAFMGGLAIGGALAGRVMRRVRRPVVAFGLAELLIGLTAFGVAWFFGHAAPLDASLHRLAGGATWMLTAARFVLALALLLVPTSLMGLTLPLISASAVVRASFGTRLSLVYGVNTAGGVLGAVVAGFVAIPAVGAGTAMRLTAALSAAVGLAALLLGRAKEDAVADGAGARGTITTGPADRTTAVPMHLLGVAVAASGAGAMALEILWFRALLQFVPATTYAFTTMLAIVLVGLALGSIGAARYLRTARRPLTYLVGAHAATAVCALASLTVLAWTFARGWVAGGPVVSSVLAMLPATLCMGASLPVTLHLAATVLTGDAEAVAGRVGRLYALNVAGAVAGALLTGFWAVPALGVRLSLVVAAGLFMLVALLLARAVTRATSAQVVAAGVAFAAMALTLPDPIDVAFARRHGADRPPLWRDEGPQATVTVQGDDHTRMLFIDGLPQASDTAGTVNVHRTIGHLAMTLHPQPVDALVIGLGGGATAGAVSRHGAALSIVELNEGVRRAAPWFADISHDVLRQPGTRVIVDDARSFLATTDARFDVITADIIQPTHAGAGGLYSREYFSRVRARLKPGGLALQWVGLREQTPYALIARTFQSVFPETTAWVGGTLLVGTLEPLTVSRAAVARHLARPDAAAALAAIGLTDVDTLLSWYSAGPEELRRFLGPGPVLTDDRPLVEFYRSLPSGERLAPLAELHGDVRDRVRP